MTSIRMPLLGAAGALLVTALFASACFADSSGRTGRTATGCSCHGSVNAGVSVTIAGPQTVEPLSTHDYTVSVSGGPATSTGGFDLKVSGGTLTAGANNRVSGSDVTHINRNSRSWTFSWTAPAATGTQNFVAVGLGCDGTGGTGGDAWNFYGGVANTAFEISVADPLDVVGTPGRTWLAPPAPNPCQRGAQLEFSLETPGVVRLEVIDPSGRRVATLVNGTLPAGRHAMRWDRHRDNGTRAVAGLYFVRLVKASEVHTTRLLVLD